MDAILMHSAYIGGRGVDFLRKTRQWDDAVIQAGIERLVDRSFITRDLTLTDGGEKFRLMLEYETDRLAAAPFAALGEETCEELLDLLRPVAMRFLESRAAPRALGRMDPANPLI